MKMAHGHLSAVAWAAACLAAPAAAQTSLVLYGNVDLGVSQVHSGAPGAAWVRQVHSGAQRASLWGLRGSEDLGGGLKAIFVLEAGIDADTGATKSFASNPSLATPTAPNGPSTPTSFGRRAVVGLEGGLGSISLGRDYTPLYYVGLMSDALRYGLWGNSQSLLASAGGSERFARVSNGLFYLSPAWQGLRLRGTYSLGSEAPGDSGGLPRGANVFYGGSLEYTAGALSVAASLQRLDVPLVAAGAFTGDTLARRDRRVGVRWTAGDLTLTAGWGKVGSPQNASQVMAGLGWKVSGAGTLLLQGQRIRQDNPAGAERVGDVWALGYVHSLSRRTDLYASLGKVVNGATSSVPLAANDTTVAAGAPGADPKAMGAGLRHSF